MKRKLLNSILLSAAFSAMLIAPTDTWAQKGEKPGGGGGGGDQPAYTIAAFLPPGSTATSSFVQAINDFGDAVGYLEYDNGQKVAVHLDSVANSYTTLPSVLIPFDVNNAGQIVGTDGSLGVFLESPSDSSPTVLPPLTGDVSSSSLGINDFGIAFGWSSGNSGDVAVVWSVAVDADGLVVVDGPVELPSTDPSYPVPPQARDINEVIVSDSGTATALVVGESAGQAVIWTVEVNDATGKLLDPVIDQIVNVPNAGYAQGNGVNNLGDVCGQSSNDPFLTSLTGTTKNLPVPRKTLFGTAFDINDYLEVVGYVEVGRSRPGTKSACLWKNGNRIDLFKQIATDSGWDSLGEAAVINELGTIGGSGYRNQGTFGFIMSPNGH